jgi:hypothetical protein
VTGPVYGSPTAAGERTLGRGQLAERPKSRANLAGKQAGLLPGGEVAAPVDLVEVDEVGIGALGPAPGRLVLLAGEDLTATGIFTPLALKKPPL